MPLAKDERDMLVRVDSHVEQLVKSDTDKETRIRSLEKKWWTTLGAFVLALMAFLKSIIPW